AGFIFGRAVGGVLFDHWGFVAPFGVSAILALIALLLAFVLVPETRSVLAGTQAQQPGVGLLGSLSSLPRPLTLFATLLVLDFVTTFGFAFIEPQMMFYMYNRLLLTPTPLRIILSGYALPILSAHVRLR